jgi:hypothetical protein
MPEDEMDYPMRSAAEMARKHRCHGLSLRNLLRANPDLVPGHAPNERYVIDQEIEARIIGHPDFAAVRRTVRG